MDFLDVVDEWAYVNPINIACGLIWIGTSSTVVNLYENSGTTPTMQLFYIYIYIFLAIIDFISLFFDHEDCLLSLTNGR